MKKKFKIENLDCGNCAAKMETAINKLEGVINCNISFLTQKMSLEIEGDNIEEILQSIEKAIKKVDRGCKLI